MRFDEARWVNEKQRPRSRSWGWVALFVCFAAVVGITWVNWRGDQNFQDVTFETWACQETLSEDASWQDVEAAECARQAGLAEITLLQNTGRNAPEASGDGQQTFEEVPTSSLEMSLEVHTTEPAGSLHVASLSDSTVQSAFNGDASDTRWTTYWRANEQAEFVVLVGQP